MSEFLYVVRYSWQIGMAISFFFLLIYFYRRRTRSDFLHVVEIILGVEGIVTLLLFCRDTLLELKCNTQFERTFLIIGFLASTWLLTTVLYKIIFKGRRRISRPY